MCWADRLGLLWILCATTFFVVIAGDRGLMLGFLFFGPGLFLLFGPWVFVRLVDMILGGPSRRHQTNTRRAIPR